VRSRAARVNSSDIRNKFWCNITVLVIVLSLFIPFKQRTLLIQHKQPKTNASGFGLRTSFYLCCKRTYPLMQKCMSRTTGKENFFRQSQLNLRVSRYKLLLLLTNRKILEFSVVAFWTVTGNENPVHFAKHRQDTTVLTAARTAGAVAVCKDSAFISPINNQFTIVVKKVIPVDLKITGNGLSNWNTTCTLVIDAKTWRVTN